MKDELAEAQKEIADTFLRSLSDKRCASACGAVVVAFDDVTAARLLVVQGQIKKAELERLVGKAAERATLAVVRNLMDAARVPRGPVGQRR